MLFNFANVFVFILFGLAMVFVSVAASRMLAPQVRGLADKFTTYECGERPVGPAWILFNFRFYTVALAFLIFEIEMALIFPCVAVFRKWLGAGAGAWALIEIVVFIGILFLGLLYMLSRGDLKWGKEVPAEAGDEVVLP